MGNKITTGEKWGQSFGSRKPDAGGVDGLVQPKTENGTVKKKFIYITELPCSPPQRMWTSSLKGDKGF